MASFKRIAAILAVTALVFYFFPSATVVANLSGCEGDVSPNQVLPESQSVVQISIQDTDVNNIQWAQVFAPSSDFTIVGVSADAGWDTSYNSSSALITDGSVSPGSTLHVNVTINTDNNQTSGDRWTIEASDDPSGANSVDCFGSQGTDIVSNGQNPPNISNIQLDDVEYNSATISWDTDQPTQDHVNYGQDTNYGLSTQPDSSAGTSHQATLTGLSPNTTYHFQIFSDAGGGNTNTSPDNTFLTPTEPPPPPTTSGTNNGGGSSNLNSLFGPPSSSTSPVTAPFKVVITNPNDKTPPKIRLNMPAARIYKTAPTLQGQATDSSSIQRVEYSVDGGVDWLPVDTTSGLNTSVVNFSFTPVNLDDGTYTIEARAIDAGGNYSIPASVKIVVDRLPPIVGGDVFNIGTLALTPDSNGTLTMPVTSAAKVTVNSVGGPINVTIKAFVDGGSASKPMEFHLARSPDNGLWSGAISFSQVGNYQLVVNAVDGAGNQTTRQLNNVTVVPGGKVQLANLKKQKQAKITVYYRDPDTGSWTLWDGTAYGQNNPLSLSQQGSYSLLLPAGTYYLRADVPGYQTMLSQSFTLDRLSVVADNFYLHKKPGLHLGPLNIDLPWPAISQTNLSSNTDTSKQRTPIALTSTLNKVLPNFSLPLTNGQNLSTADLLGKPTILTVIGTWAPAAEDQLSILNGMNRSGVNVVPVSEGEDLTKLTVYEEVAGYHLPILADQDQSLVGPLGISSLPTHYFIDRHGVVKKVMVGVLSSQELFNNIEY